MLIIIVSGLVVLNVADHSSNDLQHTTFWLHGHHQVCVYRQQGYIRISQCPYLIGHFSLTPRLSEWWLLLVGDRSSE